MPCQASLSPASCPFHCSVHITGCKAPRLGEDQVPGSAGLGQAEEQQPGCTGRMTLRFHPPTSLPTVQNPGQPGSAQQLSSARLQTTEERRREAAVGGCALVCWKKLSFSQNQEEREGKNRVGGAVWGLQPWGLHSGELQASPGQVIQIHSMSLSFLVGKMGLSLSSCTPFAHSTTNGCSRLHHAQ